MLTAIGIGNFKAFAETQRIPLRPLTLIFGANSSGKSSILHSLIYVRHALETGEMDVHRTVVGGESVDLGGFRQFVHRRDVGRRMEWSAEFDTAFFTGRLAEILASVKALSVSVSIGITLDDQGYPVPEASPEIHAYEVLGDGRSLMRMSKRRDGKLQLDRLNQGDPAFREFLKAIVESSTTTENLLPSDYDGLDEVIMEVVPEIVASVGKFLPEGLVKSETFSPSAQASFFPVSRGRRKEDLGAAVRFFMPRTLNDLIRGASRILEDEVARFQYLGPLRSFPPRHLAFAQHHDPNWFAGGGYAWEVLRQDQRVRESVNAWLSTPDRLQTPYEIKVQPLYSWNDLELPIEDFTIGTFHAHLSRLLKPDINSDLVDYYHLGEDDTGPLREFIEDITSRVVDSSESAKAFHSVLENSASATLSELILIDKRSNTVVSHRDIGIGVSQVLPVLVGAYASRNKIIAIEQPEIHLHPALQADLGDVFIQSALGENRNRFLIETHSEHLLLRIMRRMRETFSGAFPEGIPQIHPEDVMVLYVEPDGSRSIVREMPLNERGELVKAWPGGFFEEGFKEVFSD
jgi:hypothetical protein